MKSKFDFTDISQPIEERFVNLTSEVNGRVQILDYLLKNVNAYLEHLEAEVDGNPAAENYLEQCQKEIGKAVTVVADVAKIRRMDSRDEKRLELKKLLEQFKERNNKISGVQINLELEGLDDCLVKGVEDQLIEVLMFLVSCVGTEEINVKLEKIQLDDNSVTLSRSSLPHGIYWGISVAVDKGLTLQDFFPVLYSKNSAFKNKLYHRDGTLNFGTMLRYYGDLFAYDHEDGRLSLGMLLPVVESSAVQGALDDRLEDQTWHGDETVLVVDDEDMIWEILIENLQELGYTVILAEDGQDAVEIYRENPGMFDVVILDMVMPRMNGREAFGELKKLDKDVNVLLSSGYMAEGEAGDLLENGAKDFLRKPYKMIDLAKKMREILD